MYFVAQGPFHTGFSHEALDAYDFPIPIGTPIYAAVAGEVSEISLESDDGGSLPEPVPWITIYVVTDFGEMAYSHFDSVSVAQFDEVTEDTLLGYSGETPVGITSGPHLHIDNDTMTGSTSMAEIFEGIGMDISEFHDWADILSGAYVPNFPYVTVGYTPVHTPDRADWPDP